MVYGYIRVSSDKQTVENQRYEILKFCDKEQLAVGGWIEETISGTKSVKVRQLGKLLRHVKQGDLIVCSELSRLGRNLYMIMEILSICMSKGCMVWTIKDNYRLGDDIQSKVLAFAFGLSAEIERNLISMRTKEALARRKAEGVKLGRPKGHVTDRSYKLSGKRSTVRQMLMDHRPVSAIARRYKVSRSTVYAFMEREGLQFLQQNNLQKNSDTPICPINVL